MKLYNVISVIPMRIKGINGYFTADEGYIAYSAYHKAKTPEDAIDHAISYYMSKEARKGQIRAEEINDA